MSKEKRYIQWGYESFKDTKTGEIIDNHIHLLNQQDQRIAELEEQLKNAIVPKFKIGQEVWNIWSTIRIEYHRIDTIHIYRDGKIGYELDDNFDVYWEHELFATKEEAQSKLKELQGETK